ncbi:hypothetical protein OXX69_009164 [Metschnikowia pulcherrima]
MNETIFISGATGFIAQHIIKLVLSKGYKVVGTVRSADKGKHLQKLFGSDAFCFEVVPDVEPPGAFDDALKKHPEVSIFVHTASPFHFKATDIEKELLLPAVNGTKNALKAIKDYGQRVKKVVITSSYAAIMNVDSMEDSNHTDNEESWNRMTWEEAQQSPELGYVGSKKFAEEAAWNFVAEEKPKFSVSYINPSYVYGPQTFDSEVKDELNTSSEFINSFLKMNAESEIPAFKGGHVDVRDVAKAHVIAFEKDVPNQRFLMNAGTITGQDVADILNKDCPSLKGKIPVGKPGSGKQIAATMCNVDNTKTVQILGFELTDLRTSVLDSVEQILKVRKKSP